MSFSSASQVKKVLIVGSWAKEQITIENIQAHNDCDVYVYMDTKNPGIIELAKDYQVGSFYDVDDIVNYAASQKIDIALITTAAPLSRGVVDSLEAKGIAAFGPNQVAAKLESDKAFTRKLMQKHLPEFIPKFKVFNQKNDAFDYAESLDWSVAIKPIGLTDGLGVKVAGDQLHDKQQIKDYISFILDEKFSGHSQVIVEEKLTGEEFTLQCLVNGDKMVPTPAVQDFKKLLPGEKGVNTASMGSYSDTGFILPFMKKSDYDAAKTCIKKTLQAFTQETGKKCRGFLYGQFMITKNGVNLIEYNFRPGDPEWMNTMLALDDNLLNGVIALLNHEEKALSFEPKATVCKYIVPPGYPEKLDQNLDVTFNPETIKKNSTHFYYSCGLTDNGKLNVGTERGIAFIAKANTIYKANEMVDGAISRVKGDFYHREDIGTKELIESKVKHVYEMRNKDYFFTTAQADEYMKIHKFVSQCPPLEAYPIHVFKILLRYFSNTCFIAKHKEEIVAWVLGFRSQKDQSTYFLWQIGISPKFQGKGLGKKLLNHIEIQLKQNNFKRIEVTIDPENTPSQKLFEYLGYKNISETEDRTKKVNDNFAVQDYYGPGRDFMLYGKSIS